MCVCVLFVFKCVLLLVLCADLYSREWGGGGGAKIALSTKDKIQHGLLYFFSKTVLL